MSESTVTTGDGHTTEAEIGSRADIKNPIVESPGTAGIDDSLIGSIADDRDLSPNIKIAGRSGVFGCTRNC